MTWIVVFVLLIFALIFWGRQPNYYRNQRYSDFVRFIEGLIISGGDGCLLFIKHQRSARFVQFAKYISKNSDIILNFGFPDAKWSRAYFTSICKAFDANGVDYQVRGTGDTGDFVLRFIDITRKVDETAKVAQQFATIAKISFSVMGLDETQTFRIHFEGDFKIQSLRGKRQ